MNGEPLVSCIVPVFNGERYLLETLESVLAQTHRNFEIIVVNDGSTDRSGAIASSCGEPVVRIDQENCGHAAARNRGVEAATGDFVAFLDADDLWEKDKLSRQLASFEARPELGIVFTHLQNFWSPDVVPPAAGEMLPVPGYTSVSMLARRDLFDSVGPLDTSLKHGNDRDWFIRAAERGVAIEMLPDVLVRRRLHAANRSAALGSGSRSEYLRILKGSLDRRRRNGGEVVTQYPFGSGAADPE